MKSNIGSYVDKLSRNPLGIIVSFVLLIEVLSGLILGTVDLDKTLQAILVLFLVLFPIIIFSTFSFMVIKYPGNLYAPSDFKNQDHFMEIIGRNIRSEVENVSADALKELATLDIELIPILETRNLHRAEDSQKKMAILAKWVDKLESLTENTEGSRKVASAAALREVYMQYLDSARLNYGSASDYYKVKNRVVDGLKKISDIRS